MDRVPYYLEFNGERNDKIDFHLNIDSDINACRYVNTQSVQPFIPVLSSHSFKCLVSSKGAKTEKKYKYFTIYFPIRNHI